MWSCWLTRAGRAWRDRAAQGKTRRRKTTVDQTLMRGLATTGPMFVLGLPLSQSRGWIARRIRSRVALTCRRAHRGAAVGLSSPFLLRPLAGCSAKTGLRLRNCWLDHACNGPNKSCHLTSDSHNDDVLRLAHVLHA